MNSTWKSNICKRLWSFTSKNLVDTTKKLLDHAKQFATDVLKTALKRESQKTAETTGILVGNKIDDKITKVSKRTPKNNSEEHIGLDREEYKKRIYTSRKIIIKIRFIR